MRLPAALFCSIVLSAASAAAQEDVPGSKDHSMVSRFPGYVIADYKDQEFGSHEFPVAGGATKNVEGRYWEIQYVVKEGGRPGGPLQISRNYLNTFTKRGGVKLVEEVDAGGGHMSARLPVGGKNVWMHIDIANNGEIYTLTIVEEAGMEQKVEFTAAELSSLLAEKGSIALYGILFDTGLATIKAESEKTLASVGELLKQDPALRLEVQGHTDNVGAKGTNLKLSKERAAAVRDYLVRTQGIAAARLTAEGFGDTRPVADNATDEGRARNRRVELVKK